MKLAFEIGESFAQVTIQGTTEAHNGLYFQTCGNTTNDDTAELDFNVVGYGTVQNYGEEAKATLKVNTNTHFRQIELSNEYAVVVDGCVFQKVVTD